MNHSSIPTSSHSSSTGGTSLLIRLRERDAEAWQQMVDLYGPLIFHWCQKCGLDSADSADVMQDVFVMASRKIEQFGRRDGATLRGWLWAITQNKIRDHFRHLAKRDVATGGTAAAIRMSELAQTDPESKHDMERISLEMASDNLPLKEPTEAIQAHRLLYRAMNQIRPEFSENSWTAFWRNVVQGDQTTEIAKDLGISAAGVRQAKRRVLRRLREQLGDSA